MSWFRLGFLSLPFCLAATPSGADTLSLQAYLDQVLQQNRSIQGAKATIEAGELRSSTPDLIYSPQFFSQAAHSLDSKPPLSIFSPKKTEATSLTLGLQKLWETGLQSQIAFHLTRVDLENARFPGVISLPISLPNPLNPAAPFNQIVSLPNPLTSALPQDEFTEARTQIDLLQPLLKNSEGRDQELTRDSLLTKIAMQKSGEQYRIKAMLAQAEYVYWQLALAQEAVRTQEQSLSRFKKLKEWAQRRAHSQLGDRADVLQAESGLKLRNYELEQSKKDRAAAERLFNNLRGKSGADVEAQLSPISTHALSHSDATGDTARRLDIEVAKQAQKLAEIEVEQSREKFRSQLDVFGSVAFNSQERTPEDAVQGAFQNKHPTYVVGIKFSTPLDQDLIDRERNGLIRASQAAQLDVEQKSFSAQQDWEDLHEQLADAQMRLKIAVDLESTQKEKLAYEKLRLERGRTTTYQILMFEQDFAQSQLATIKAKTEILGIVARLKSFGDAL